MPRVESRDRHADGDLKTAFHWSIKAAHYLVILFFYYVVVLEYFNFVVTFCKCFKHEKKNGVIQNVLTDK